MLPFDIFPLHAEAIPRIVQGDYSSVRKRNFFVFSRYYVYTACLLAWEPKLNRVYSTPKLESTMVCADPKLRSAIAATNADLTRFFFFRCSKNLPSVRDLPGFRPLHLFWI